MESIEQTFNGSADFGKKVTCTISRNGDLIHRVYLRTEIPTVTLTSDVSGGKTRGARWLNWLGHILVKTVEVEIGGQRIDKHYGEWLHIWNELTQTAGHALGYANMVGNTPDLTALKTVVASTPTTSVTIPGKTLWIPMQFWFCRNAGLALPLIALQYHEVKVNLEFRDFADCFWSGEVTSGVWANKTGVISPSAPSLGSTSLYVDFVYLDTDERRRMAQSSHEYLIEQLQFTGDESTSQTQNKLKLNFNHPTKELIWVVSKDAVHDDASGALLGKQWFNFTDAADTTVASSVFTNVGAGAPGGFGGLFGVTASSGANPVSLAKIQLNGHDRFSERDGSYFNLVQPYQHHECVPATGINVYSFGLLPETHQPSGTCNMSRIDNAILNLTLTAAAVSGGSNKIKIFAVNYNVLRIMSGMGGLAYSN